MNSEDKIRIEKKLDESSSRMFMVALIAFTYVCLQFYLSWNEYASVLAFIYIILNPILICSGFLYSKKLKDSLKPKLAGFIFLTSSGFFSMYYFYFFYSR